MRTPWHLSRRRTQIPRTGIRTIVARKRDPTSTARAAHGGAVTGNPAFCFSTLPLGRPGTGP